MTRSHGYRVTRRAVASGDSSTDEMKRDRISSVLSERSRDRMSVATGDNILSKFVGGHRDDAGGKGDCCQIQ